MSTIRTLTNPVNTENSETYTCSDGVSVPAILVDKKNNGYRYKIVSLLGRGAFGRCYHVKSLDGCGIKDIACKAIDKETFKSRKVVERVRYEVRVMRSLPKHENIVESYHIFEDSWRLYMLMELCTGRTLHDLLQKRKRLTEFEARYFTMQLANGLAALHNANIIHRDIKHSNLLLDRDNRLKIADFGLSTIVDCDIDRRLSFLGTPNFLAPELVNRNGEGHSFGVDVWATGILLFVMLYGYPPFHIQRGSVKANLQVLYRQIVDQQIEFPPTPPVTESVKLLINKLCCKVESSRLKAHDICLEPWFSISDNNSVPQSMPDLIFDRPIRNAREHRILMHEAGKVAAYTKPMGNTMVQFANKLEHLKSKIPQRLANMRHPLEPIPENTYHLGGKRPADTANSNNARYIKKVELETKPKAILGTHRYSLRSRTQASQISSVASVEQNNQKIPVQLKNNKNNIKTSLQCRVQCEFGRITKLSEDYIPSTLEWRDRLRKFCYQTEEYLAISNDRLEVELRHEYGNSSSELLMPYPPVGMYVMNWMGLTKYGLGFRLSDGTTGVLFNDNTSLLYLEDDEEFVYLRPNGNGSNMGHFGAAKFPHQLNKKRRLLRSFSKSISKTFSPMLDRDICPNSEGLNVIKCLLHALATNVGMVFLLTGNVLQFNMRDHSKLFLYQDSHIFYKSPTGNKWHFDLHHGPSLLVRDSRIDIAQFLSCLSYAQKVLDIWDISTNRFPLQKGQLPSRI